MHLRLFLEWVELKMLTHNAAWVWNSSSSPSAICCIQKSIQCVAQTQIAFYGTKSSGRQTYVVYFICAKAAKGLGSLLLFFIRPLLRHWKLSALTPTCAQCRHCSVTLFSLLIFYVSHTNSANRVDSKRWRGRRKSTREILLNLDSDSWPLTKA